MRQLSSVVESAPWSGAAEVEVAALPVVPQRGRQDGRAVGPGEPGDLIVEVRLGRIAEDRAGQPHMPRRRGQAGGHEGLVERVAQAIDVEVAEGHEVVAEGVGAARPVGHPARDLGDLRQVLVSVPSATLLAEGAAVYRGAVG